MKPVAFLIIAFVFLLSADQVSSSPPSLTPVPSPEAQDTAEKLVKSIFKDDFAKAKQPSDKRMLSQKLLNQAVETTDDLVSAFILFREARDLAIEVGAVGVVLDAITQMGERYDIDTKKVTLEALVKASKASKPVAPSKEDLSRVVGLVEAAVTADDFGITATLNPVVIVIARGINTDVLKSATIRVREIETIQKSFEAVKAARQKLANDPTDADANLAEGKYLCFMKGDWENGLARLAIGSNAELKRLAEKDLTKPTAAVNKVELADRWWDLADKENGLTKAHLALRAKYWYDSASDSLTGLNATKVEQRSKLIAKYTEGTSLAGKTTLGTQKQSKEKESPLVEVSQDAKTLPAKWFAQVALLPPTLQVQEVVVALKELNPAFGGSVTPKIENGVVTELSFFVDDVSDISPVRVLRGLRSLKCTGSDARQSSGKLKSIAPLKGLRLLYLDINSTKVEDLSPLEGMKLKSITFFGTGVTDLSPLRGMPLNYIDFGMTRISDVGPLAGMPLREFYAPGTDVNDISPLKGMRLERIKIDETKIGRFDVLKGMPISFLTAARTQLADLSLLQGMPIKVLWCEKTAVQDLTPLRGLPLEELSFTPSSIHKGIDDIRQKKSIKRLGPYWYDLHSPEQFWRKYDAGDFKNP